MKLLLLVPSEAVKDESDADAFAEAVTLFSDDMPSPHMFAVEFQRWKEMCRTLAQPPTTLAATIKICDADIYPNIFSVLTISCTWPVTTCECERSFSGLRRLNTYLRSSQTSERLDALAMMSIHRSMPVDVDAIIDLFSTLHPRRMRLTDVLKPSDI